MSWAFQPRKSTTGTIYTQTCAGGLTFAGNHVKQTVKLIAGVLTFAGATLKQTAKIVAGTLSFSGALSAIRTLLQAVGGTLSFASGTVVKSTAKLATGALSFSGGVIKVTQKLMLSTLSFAGQSIKAISKNVAGFLSFAGMAVASLIGAVILGALTALLKLIPALRADAKGDPAVAGKTATRASLNGEPKTK